MNSKEEETYRAVRSKLIRSMCVDTAVFDHDPARRAMVIIEASINVIVGGLKLPKSVVKDVFLEIIDAMK